MATSGTYNFAPSVGDLTMNAFARIGMRRPELTAMHLADAALEANLLQAQFDNLQPNLWRTELVEIPLVSGTATYALPARMIALTAVYVSYDNGQNTIDRLLGPLSAFEYAAQPNKETLGIVTSYWYNRLSSPEITLWPVPDDQQEYTLKVRMYSQIQDAALPNGVQPDLPLRFLDAFTAGLAHRLARIYKPEFEERRKADALEAWNMAANQDTETISAVYILPGLSGYWN